MVEQGEDGVDPQSPPPLTPEVKVGPVGRLDLKDPLQLSQLNPGVLPQQNV